MVAQLPWLKSIILHGETYPSTHTSALVFRSTIHTNHLTNRALETPVSAQDEIASLDKGTKIGIIVGTAVIGILAAIGSVLWILSCKKRHARHKEQRQHRNAELLILQSEMKSGKTGQKHCPAKGLWDDLKVRVVDDEERNPTICDAWVASPIAGEASNDVTANMSQGSRAEREGYVLKEGVNV